MLAECELTNAMNKRKIIIWQRGKSDGYFTLHKTIHT